MDQRGTSLVHLLPLVLRFSFPLSYLRCYWVTLLIYSRDTASPTFVPAVSLYWNGLIKIPLLWKCPASARPTFKSPAPILHSCCNQDRFLFTKTMEPEVNFNAELLLPSLSPWPQHFSNVSAANWSVMKQKHAVFGKRPLVLVRVKRTKTISWPTV